MKRSGAAGADLAWRRRNTPSARWFQLVVATLALAWAVAVPIPALSATASTILAAPERYDGQTITLQGTVTHLSERVSQRGNTYYTFDLRDETGTIRVFSFGKAPCAEGMRAAVDGAFVHMKQVGRYTFFNELTATRVVCR